MKRIKIEHAGISKEDVLKLEKPYFGSKGRVRGFKKHNITSHQLPAINEVNWVFCKEAYS